MAGGGLVVRGASETADRLRRAAGDLDELELGELGEAMRSAAVGLAPRRTGRLAGVIRAEASPGAVRLIAAGLAYVGVQEGGWAAHRIAPHLFMRGALDAARGARAATTVEAAVDDTLRRNGLHR